MNKSTTKIRITKEFNFEMAHALVNYDGLCKHIHGHSYKLFVTIISSPINDENSPKNGMVMDFGELKQIVNKQIISPLDHAFVVNKKTPAEWLSTNNELFQKTEKVDYQPTCENMIIDFAERIKKMLPKNITLHSLKLNETASSYAEWYAEDQD